MTATSPDLEITLHSQRSAYQERQLGVGGSGYELQDKAIIMTTRNENGKDKTAISWCEGTASDGRPSYLDYSSVVYYNPRAAYEIEWLTNKWAAGTTDAYSRMVLGLIYAESIVDGADNKAQLKKLDHAFRARTASKIKSKSHLEALNASELSVSLLPPFADLKTAKQQVRDYTELRKIRIDSFTEAVSDLLESDEEFKAWWPGPTALSSPTEEDRALSNGLIDEEETFLVALLDAVDADSTGDKSPAYEALTMMLTGTSEVERFDEFERKFPQFNLKSAGSESDSESE